MSLTKTEHATRRQILRVVASRIPQSNAAHILTFHADGSCTGLKTESFPLNDLGNVTLTRVSHIWPANPVKRVAFRLIRAIIGERGRIAEWCRHWRGPWQVRFAATPHEIAFMHPSRRVCIEWEISKLNGNV